MKHPLVTIWYISNPRMEYAADVYKDWAVWENDHSGALGFSPVLLIDGSLKKSIS